MSISYLIGKHLISLENTTNMINTCGICGAKNVPGYKISKIVSSSFMDWDVIQGDEVCQYCAVCLGKDIPRSKRLCHTSFWANDSQLKRLGREEIWDFLFSPPAPPFVFCATYSYKKHIFFKAPVNYDRNYFTIQTDKGAVDIVPAQISGLCGIIQNWYTVCKDTKTQPTWFTKDDILTGCTNYKKIEAYGAARYLEEDKVLAQYRNTGLLQLLVYAVNKGERKND